MAKPAQELLHRGLQLLTAGQLKEAQRACRKAIEARPDLPEAHLLMSEIHHQGGDAAKAREAAARALRLRPEWSEAYVALGNADALAGKYRSAEEHFRAAIARGTPMPGIHANLGHVLLQQGRLAEAHAAYERAAAHAPGHPEFERNVAMVLSELRRDEEAVPRYRRALELDPTASETREHLLRALHATRRFADMEGVAREGIEIHPGSCVYPHQLAAALWWQERHGEAISAFQKIEHVGPDRSSAHYRSAKLDEANCLLALGHWRRGWEAYSARAVRLGWRERFPQLVDDARSVAALAQPSRILIVGEQGLGDELFFLRFAPYLRERGHELVGIFDRRLLPLISGLFTELHALDDDPTPRADVTVLSGDLPLATGQAVAPALPLAVDPLRRERMEGRLRSFGPPPYIGVTWRAGALPEERTVRGGVYLVKEIPITGLASALAAVNARVVVLQRRPAAEDQPAFKNALGRAALDMSDVNQDLGDALAALSLLHDYVGPSNTNTHLRAALNAPARVLVPFPAEWRWGVRGSATQWFPGFAVYRQSRESGWGEALKALQSALAADIAA